VVFSGRHLESRPGYARAVEALVEPVSVQSLHHRLGYDSDATLTPEPLHQSPDTIDEILSDEDGVRIPRLM
jgi:hypothetical protein